MIVPSSGVLGADGVRPQGGGSGSAVSRCCIDGTWDRRCGRGRAVPSGGWSRVRGRSGGGVSRWCSRPRLCDDTRRGDVEQGLGQSRASNSRAVNTLSTIAITGHYRRGKRGHGVWVSDVRRVPSGAQLRMRVASTELGAVGAAGRTVAGACRIDGTRHRRCGRGRSDVGHVMGAAGASRVWLSGSAFAFGIGEAGVSSERVRGGLVGEKCRRGAGLRRFDGAGGRRMRGQLWYR
jgi:hypothetical protein